MKEQGRDEEQQEEIGVECGVDGREVEHCTGQARADLNEGERNAVGELPDYGGDENCYD